MKTIINIVNIGGRKKVCADEIMLLQADQNYTIVIFKDGKKILVAKTLKELEKRLSNFPIFFRTHKSFIVNLRFAENIGCTLLENYLSFPNETKVCVSRRRKNDLEMRILQL